MEKLPPKPRKPKGATREELLKLSKEELVDRIIQLEAHNAQLKNIISKNVNETDETEENKTKKKFDFAKCHFRPVFLHIMYFGWDYQGFVVQEDTMQTIEHQLFRALNKTCFIENRETAKYHRCGRTDKGVSAFGQVVSISLRSKHTPDKLADPSSISTEFNYCKILNRVLPKDIRVIAWMPVPDDVSARFACKQRQYKYYFPRSSLHLNKMRVAASSLIGSHDFRNLCKMDVGNGVTEFTRRVLKADVVAVDEDDLDRPTSMYYLLIEANAFLWHQIRCIQAILLMVGSGVESPDIVAKLLDHQTYNRKPQYNMAIDLPLNLFKCSYDIEDTQWVYDEETLGIIIYDLQGEWTKQSIKTTMLKDCLQNLEEIYAKMVDQQIAEGSNNKQGEIIAYHHCLTEGVKPKAHTPLMKRGTCSSLEEKIQHYTKRRKQYKS